MKKGESATSTHGLSLIFRDPANVWKTFAAFLYAILADVAALVLMVQKAGARNAFGWAASILLAAHGRIVASYLVHEATHASVFVEKWPNELLGILSLWLAGCPYADFDHVRKMHVMHHKDRADVVEFDYRAFVNDSATIIRNLVLTLEWAFIPIIETIMHFRTAFYPIFRMNKCTASRTRSALVGTLTMLLLYMYLWKHGAVLPQILSGAFVLHFLSMLDAFHHTYEAIPLKDYTPGPGKRTAQFEEENTYSNIISERFPLLNLLALNFGYHNAHHKKPMVPWYNLPKLHENIYDNTKESSQLLPLTDILYAWYAHRLRRVLEEDYGVVHPLGTPGRANDFVGALGVSFLTV